MFSIVNSSLRRRVTIAAATATAAPTSNKCNNNIVIAAHQHQRHRGVVRYLSTTNIQSRDKLNAILEEYRRTNFPEELPQRVWKDITKAATKNNRQQRIVLVKPLPPSLPFVAVSAEGIENVLRNIGFGHVMSREEIEELVSEVGGDMTVPSSIDGERHSVMSATQLFDLISRECPPQIQSPRRASIGGVVSSISTTQKMAYASSFMMASSIESSKTSSYVALA